MGVWHRANLPRDANFKILESHKCNEAASRGSNYKLRVDVFKEPDVCLRAAPIVTAV